VASGSREQRGALQVALLTTRLIDYGVGTNQVHLGIVLDSDGSDKAALTDDAQTIGGLKIFSEVVTSPNSPATLDEIEDNNEFVTFEQLGGYQEEIEGDRTPATVVTIPGVIAGLPNRPINIIDTETGTLIGRLPSIKYPGLPAPPSPATTPPEMIITPLPESPGQYTLPGVGPGGVRFINGHLVYFE
jgi:hypothetical protein